MASSQETIKTLPPEKEKLIPKYANKWIKTSLATGPADEVRCRKLIPEIYKNAGLTPPPNENYMFVRSPAEAVMVLCENMGKGPETDDVDSMIYGNQDCAWLFMYDFLNKEMNLKTNENIECLKDLAECCGWWSPFDGAVIVQDRPEAIHLNRVGKPHNVNGMSIIYSDGYGCYTYNGSWISKWVIETPHYINLNDINTASEINVKMCMIEKFGIEKFVRESNIRNFDKNEFVNVYKTSGENSVVILEALNNLKYDDKTLDKGFYIVNENLKPVVKISEYENDYGENQSENAKNALACMFDEYGKSFDMKRLVVVP